MRRSDSSYGSREYVLRAESETGISDVDGSDSQEDWKSEDASPRHDIPNITWLNFGSRVPEKQTKTIKFYRVHLVRYRMRADSDIDGSERSFRDWVCGGVEV